MPHPTNELEPPASIARTTRSQRGAARALDSAVGLWQASLAQFASVFGRLVYVASLRDSNTGRYQHWRLARVLDEDAEVDRLLRQSHHDMFFKWLCFGLERQKADLDEYLNRIGGDKRSLLESWLRFEPYRNMVPAAATGVERRLFCADFEALLSLLRNEHGVDLCERD